MITIAFGLWCIDNAHTNKSTKKSLNEQLWIIHVHVQRCGVVNGFPFTISLPMYIPIYSVLCCICYNTYTYVRIYTVKCQPIAIAPKIVFQSQLEDPFLRL